MVGATAPRVYKGLEGLGPKGGNQEDERRLIHSEHSTPIICELSKSNWEAVTPKPAGFFG